MLPDVLIEAKKERFKCKKGALDVLQTADAQEDCGQRSLGYLLLVKNTGRIMSEGIYNFILRSMYIMSYIRGSSSDGFVNNGSMDENMNSVQIQNLSANQLVATECKPAGSH
jgi:hypothetical protein